MPKIRLDDLPIRQIGWDPGGSMPSDYSFVKVGEEGISKIDIAEQVLGDYSICWFQVWRDDEIVGRYNARNVDSILY